MNKLLIVISILVLYVAILQGQSGRSGDILGRLKNLQTASSRITINIDSLIEKNYYKHILHNQRNPGAMGYQIRIFSGSGSGAKDNAEKARSLFIYNYENIEAYLLYDTPDYKVYVGDCRTKSEQIRLINHIRYNFPNAFPVYRRINVSYD